MKNIIILRGPQGVGKSSFAKSIGLEGHHLSFDKVREAVSGDTLHANGEMTIPQQHNQLVWRMTMESLQRRMMDGETIIFEGTLSTRQDVDGILSKAKWHGYAVMIIDYYDIPIEDVKKANAKRPERIRVPDYSIERMYKMESTQKLEKIDAEIIRIKTLHDTKEAEERAFAFLTRHVVQRDVSGYRKVVHIGDLQGTLHPIFDQESPLANGVEDDVLYIFTGDLFDRGVENDKVATWWMRNAIGRENVILISGNHEDHVENAAAGRDALSREWRDRTWPQLEAAGYSSKDMAAIAECGIPLLNYVWRGTEVLVTHGGFPRWPSHLHLVPDALYRRGSGHYGQGVDEMWTDAEKERQNAPRYQVHGHRNSKILPVQASEYSFNLEGQVEFGGHLRFAVLDENGWQTMQIRSKEYRDMQTERAIAESYKRQPYGNEAPIVAWIKEGRNALEPLSENALASFENHRMIAVNPSASMPHVSSVNFTKSAFYSQTWDSYTTVARGLFIDNLDNSIVARSFEKFFNHGERPETSDEHMEQNLVFPVDAYDKINGYLGITGYCERTGELIVASKSRVEGDYAQWARELLEEKLGAGGMEKILRFNRDQKASLIFEIVDMKNDPHIIDYPESRVVLIGCVRRHETFEQVDYETLVKIASWLGCEVKERLHRAIPNWRALRGIMDRVEKDPKWQSHNPTEGIVFQDASGFQWKSKAYFYASWKRMRSAVERIALCRRKGDDFDDERYADMPEFTEFLQWARTLPDAALSSTVGIIALRNMWFNDRTAAENMGDRYEAPEKKKDMSGYVRAVQSVAKQIHEGTAKIDTVKKMLNAANDDENKREALSAMEEEGVLRSFVAEHS